MGTIIQNRKPAKALSEEACRDDQFLKQATEAYQRCNALSSRPFWRQAQNGVLKM